MRSPLLRWIGRWESYFLDGYRDQPLGVRTKLRILLAVLGIIFLTVIVIGVPQVLLATSAPTQWGIALMFVLPPLFALLLKQGHRHLVTLLYVIGFTLVVVVPQVLDARDAYEVLKIDRLIVMGLLQLLIVASVTERASHLLLTYVVFLLALGFDVFWALPAHPEAEWGELFRVSSRSFVYLTLAWFVLSLLQRGFHRALHAVESANRLLEQRVRRRTEELNQAQALLRAGEKLVIQGRLAALVAHEINTPLAAIQSSSYSVGQVLPQLVLWAARPPSPEQSGSDPWSDFWSTLAQAAAHLGTRPSRTERRQMAEVFTSWGVGEPEHWAERFADAGITHVPSTWAPLLIEPRSRPSMVAAFQASEVLRSMTVIDTALNKATRFVDALRKSTQDRRTDALREPVDLVASVTGVLNIFGVANRVNFVFPQGTLPPLMGFPGRLLLLWASLIIHALRDADSQAPIVLALTRTPDQWEMVITYSGMAPTISNDLSLDPELDLGLARGIALEHGGGFEVQQDNAEARFTVRLPLAPQ